MVRWPNAREGLSSKEAQELNEFVAKWKDVDLDAYLNHPLTNVRLAKREYSALKERVQKIVDFAPFSENQTFEAFFLYFYPDLLKGVGEILPFLQRMTHKPISQYSALFYLSHHDWWEKLPPEDNEKIKDWIEKYHRK